MSGTRPRAAAEPCRSRVAWSVPGDARHQACAIVNRANRGAILHANRGRAVPGKWARAHFFRVEGGRRQAEMELEELEEVIRSGVATAGLHLYEVSFGREAG